MVVYASGARSVSERGAILTYLGMSACKPVEGLHIQSLNECYLAIKLQVPRVELFSLSLANNEGTIKSILLTQS